MSRHDDDSPPMTWKWFWHCVGEVLTGFAMIFGLPALGALAWIAFGGAQ